ncbi:MAG TPA: subtype I-C CRISPR-associated endonuclease Cas1 [Solibacterales bacterium]|nr:subtype I-C CRISPR-associated endonuclease Cas1 [Bryobacterales bacterium]
MKKLLNTLFVTRQGVYLAKDGECIAVREGGGDLGETLLRVPIHTLESIVCFGRVSASPPLMGFCGENHVLLSFFAENGQFLARVHGRTVGNILLRRSQYRIADHPEAAAGIAQSIVCAKTANSRLVVQRAARDHPDFAEPLSAAADRLAIILRRLQTGALPLDILRGIEGEAAQHYFSAFDAMICAQKQDFTFLSRSRRPPRDRINALLSFLYTLLTHDCAAALEGVGLDASCGFLHVDRPGRPSLALDLIEELRPVLADRLALSLVNRLQVKPGDFEHRDSGAVFLSESGRKQVIAAWQERKRDAFTHPVIGERLELGLLPHVQALLLARHIRGDIAGYPSLLWK